MMDIFKATPMGGMFNVGSKLLSGEMPGIKDIAGAMIPGFGALDLASKVLGGGTPAQSPAAQAGGTKPEAGKSGIGLTDILKSTPMGGMFSIGSKLLSGEMPNMKDLATAFVPGYGAFDLASKALMGDTTQTKVADGTKPTTATTEKTTQPIPVQIVGGSATKETLSGTMADKSIFDKISDALFSKPKEQKSFNIVNNTSTTQVGGAMTTTPQSIRENVQITEPILLSAVRNDLSYM
jgi:hypothetical protein